jgi:DNA polymerase-1
MNWQVVFKVPVNGRIGKATAEVADGDGKLLDAVRVDMLDMPDRRALVRRVAALVGEDEKAVGRAIAGAWAAKYREASARVDERAGHGDVGDDDGDSQRDRLVRLAVAPGAELFHAPGDDDAELYVTFDVEGRRGVPGHRETWPLGSAGCRRWLTRLYFGETGRAPAAQPVEDAINTLRAKARFEGAEYPVTLRVAEHDDKIYLDLCDRDWRAVEVDADGWRVVSNPPVRFIRRRGMLPLPVPRHGGTVDALRKLVNVPDEASWKLVVGFLLACLRPNRPFPILVVLGEQGSAKSHLCRLVRRLIDPNKAPLRRLPRDERDLMIAANNGWLVALDNVSGLPDWLSDALCSLSTGAGFGTRALYTDDDEKLFDAMRPIMLNGIGDVVVRGDAVDRGLFPRLPAIPDERRRTADAVDAAFAKVHARVLGALLTAVSRALRDLPTTTLPAMPRMADFAQWIEAAAPALGWKAGEFLDAYQANRAEANAAVLEASHVASAVQALVDTKGGFDGMMKELLEKLGALVDEKTRSGRDWPKNPRKLRSDLDRVAPALRRAEINVRYLERSKRGTHVLLEKGRGEPTPPTPPTPEGTQGDGQQGVDVGVGPCPPTDTTYTDLHQPSETDADVNSDSPDDCEAPGEPGVGGVGGVGLLRLSSQGQGESPAPPAPPGEVALDLWGTPPVRAIADKAALPGLAEAVRAAGVVGLDCETTGLDPRSDRVRLLSLAVGGRAHVVDVFAVDPAPLWEALAAVPIVGHNLSFDLQFLARLGFEPGECRDTMLMSQVLHAGERDAGNRRLKHTLAACCERELGEAVDKAEQRSDWSGALTPDQLAYAARDAELACRLHDALAPKLAAAGLTATADLENRALPAVAWMAGAGVAFDRDGWLALAERAQAEAERLKEQLNSLAPERFDQTGTKAVARNWDSPQQVKEALAALGAEVPNTRDETLAAVDRPVDARRLAALLRRYREWTKRATTYGPQWVKESYADGRVYAGWGQAFACSGRMTCSRPNLQNLPRDPRYRRCVIAPEGRVLVKADYSQIELRIAARVAGERDMLDAYDRGGDLHTLTARRVLGKEEVSKADRQTAKSLNFGLLFGMGAAALQGYARSNYGVELTDEQARGYRAGFFDAYPGLRRWHAQAGRSGGDAVETRTLGGRRRLAVSRFTEKLNSPVQGTGADGLKAALALLWERRAECAGAVPVLAVHDEIVVECATGQADAASAWLKRAMLDGMAPLIAPVPVEVEVSVGAAWAVA